MLSIDALSKAYQLILAENGGGSDIIDEFLGSIGTSSQSILCNEDEGGLYRAMSSNEGGRLLSDLYQYFISAAKAGNGNDGILQQLDIFQHLLAKKLWKYNSPTSVKLDRFTMDFDRLDQVEERARWYRESVVGHEKGVGN